MDDLPSADRLLHADAKRVRRRLNSRKRGRYAKPWGGDRKPFRVHANRTERHYVHRHLHSYVDAPDYKHFTPYDVRWNWR